MTDGTSVDLVFDEMKERLRRQEAALDEVRGRGGVVLGVSSLAASFLGGALLDRGGLGPGFWVGVAFLIGAVVTAMSVTFPREAWQFSPLPEHLLASWIDLPPLWYRRYLSEHMSEWIRDNQSALDPLHGRLKWAIRAAGLGIVVWLADLGGLF